MADDKELKKLRMIVSKYDKAEAKAYARLRASDTVKNEERYQRIREAGKEASADLSEAELEAEKKAKEKRLGVRPATGAKPLRLEPKQRVNKSLLKPDGGSRGQGGRGRSGLGAAVERWSQLFADDV